MKSDLEIAWREFKCKVEDLFALGFSLPLSLHVSAIHKVGDKLQAWKDEIEKTGTSDGTNKQILVGKRRKTRSAPATPHKNIAVKTVKNLSIQTRSRTNGSDTQVENVSTTTQRTVKRNRGRPRKGTTPAEPLVVDAKDDEKRPDEDAKDNLSIDMSMVKSEAERIASEALNNVSLTTAETYIEAENLIEDVHTDNFCNENSDSVANVTDSADTRVGDTTVKSVIDEDNKSGVETDDIPVDRSSVRPQPKNKIKIEHTPKKPKRPAGRPRKETCEFIMDKKAPEKHHFCEQCGKGFVTKAALKKHQQIHESGPLLCTVCDKHFFSYPGYTTHMKLHNNTAFQCPECPYRTGGKIWLEKHIMHVHRKDDPSSRPHLCDHCGAAFVSTNALKRHVQSHIRSKIYNCPDCDHKTHNPELLAVHRKNIHLDKDPYICNICGATCKYRASLVEHQRRHFSEKPFKCETCDYRCVSSTMLHKHRKKHQAPTHKCDTCDKSFRTKEHLKRHMVIHTGEKLYKCDLCAYRCNVPSNLHKHMKNLHNVRHVSRVKRVERLEEIALEPGIIIASAINIVPQDTVGDTAESIGMSGETQYEASMDVIPEDSVPHVQHEVYLDSGEQEDKEAVEMVQYVMEEYPGDTDTDTTHYIQHIPTAHSLTTLQNIGPTEALPRVTHYNEWTSFTPQ